MHFYVPVANENKVMARFPFFYIGLQNNLHGFKAKKKRKQQFLYYQITGDIVTIMRKLGTIIDHNVLLFLTKEISCASPAMFSVYFCASLRFFSLIEGACHKNVSAIFDT